MFYYKSTFELYAELIEPETMRDAFIKDPRKDGVRYVIVFDANKSIVKEGVLGNTAENSYISFNNHIDIPNKEGVYRVCFSATDSLFHNAATATQNSGEEETTAMFGKIFQQQDFSKLSFEVSVTLERVFHGQFETEQDLQQAQESSSKRQNMAA